MTFRRFGLSRMNEFLHPEFVPLEVLARNEESAIMIFKLFLDVEPFELIEFFEPLELTIYLNEN